MIKISQEKLNVMNEIKQKKLQLAEELNRLLNQLESQEKSWWSDAQKEYNLDEEKFYNLDINSEGAFIVEQVEK